MLDASLRQTLERIYASPRQAVIEFAGAGSAGLAAMHAVGGSSRLILEATDHYSAASMRELLGVMPEKFVEPAVAAAMADRAYLRAARLGDDSKFKLGIGCTATIATDRAKRGEHRCCIAVQDHQSVTTHDLVLAKGKRDRADEEAVVAELLIGAIADSCGVATVALKLLAGEGVARQTVSKLDSLELLKAGQTRWVTIEAGGRRESEGKVHGLIYCGSFDPLHFGHEALAAAAARVSGLPVTFELAAVNAEKAALGRGEIERRAGHFLWRNRLVVTQAPLFAEKAMLFPGCTFVVGYDTAARLVNPRFYGNSEVARDQALAVMRQNGCHVLVAGRIDGAVFKTMKDLSIPGSASPLFIELPQSEFRADISATILRSIRPAN